MTEQASGPENEKVPGWSWLAKLGYGVLVVCVLALPCSPFIGTVVVGVYNIQRERYRLLHETDHRALLAASREMMRDYAGHDIDNPAEDPRVPLIIRELGPSYLIISADQLRVELHGGFEHYGYVAFSEGAVEDGRYGRKLIDGLFYFTD